ncbi:hypothetical protein SRHO_G00067670 [Serrasalmus rhombeus]
MKTSVCFEQSSECVCVLPSAVDRLPGSNMGLLSGTGPVEADANSAPKPHPLLTVPPGSSSQVVLGRELGGGMSEWFQVVWRRLTDGWANQVSRRPWGKRGWSGPKTAELKNQASAIWAAGL